MTKFFETKLPGLMRLVRPTATEHNNSLYDEVVNIEELSRVIGKPFHLQQVNHSRSVKGVLRGLHAERWDKIVWVPRGRAFSAIVDIRPDSPTFGQHATFELSNENRQALYIPEGFANSAFALEDLDYMYMVTKLYDGSDTFAVAWDDPDINVSWPHRDPIISQRDRNNPRLRQLFPEKF